MKNKKKKPTSSEIVQDSYKMSAEDYLYSVLSLEKNMSNYYSLAMSDASNDIRYNEFFDLFEDSKEATRQIIDCMYDHGWYHLEEATKENLNQKITQLEKKLQQLKY